MSDIEDEPQLLSEELMLALGGDSNSLLVMGGKKSKKAKADSEVAPEVKQLAQQLSKRATKKLNQLKLRKEKEANRSNFLEVIHQNEISDKHRMLLTSSKDIGQKKTTKQLLSNILKRQRSGLPISEEESELLFKNTNPVGGDAGVPDFSMFSHIQSAVDGDEGQTSLVEDNQSMFYAGGAVPSDVVSRSSSVAPALFLNRSSQIDKNNSNTESLNTATSVTIAKKSKKSPTVEVPKPAEINVVKTSPSVGSNLLEQLANLKKRRCLPSAVQRAEESDDDDDDDDDDDSIAPLLVPMESIEKTEISEDKQAKYMVQREDKTSKTIRALDCGALSQKRKLLESTHDVSKDSDTENSAAFAMFSQPPVESFTGASGHGGFVKVYRTPEVQQARMELPVCKMEQEIIEAVQSGDVIILCGETGSGKSTQIPQFLYENGFANGGMTIGITQPRRVAATSTALRVSYEMGCGDGIRIGQPGIASGHGTDALDKKKSKKKKMHKTDGGEGTADPYLVGYQIRYDASTLRESSTRIKFMTDGILLKEITHDLLLRKYSVIVLDEAHERNVNTDVLLGMLSRAIPLRRRHAKEEARRYNALSAEERSQYLPPLRPLKLIIMSATLRVEEFQNPILFSPTPQVIHVAARQHPVTAHFARRTELKNYLKETHKKVCQIHRRLPEGGILIFLTGKREIMYMCNKLSRSLNGKPAESRKRTAAVAREEENSTAREINEKDGGRSKSMQLVKLLKGRSSMGFSQSGDSAEYVADSEDEAGDSNDGDERGVVGDVDSELRAMMREYGGYSRSGLDDQSDIESDAEEDEEDEEENEGETNENEKTAQLDDLDPHDRDSRLGTNAAKQDIKIDVQSEVDIVRQKLLKEALDAVPSNIVAVTTDGQKDGSEADPLVNTEESGNERDEEVPALKAWVVPLHAMLSEKQQARVFRPPPDGYRLIVVATNVAETSITIPGVRYVVDCGRQKNKVHRSKSGITQYEVGWVSQASADQRKGRAGRTGPGHCYRLYSANFFHQYLTPFQPPEISSAPLEDLILQMKSIGITRIDSFPFPTPPPPATVETALDLLLNLGALQNDNSTSIVTSSSTQHSPRGASNSIGMKTSVMSLLKGIDQLTAAVQSVNTTASLQSTEDIYDQQLSLLNDQPDNRSLSSIGLLLARFPINPRFGKMILTAHFSDESLQKSSGRNKHLFLRYTLTIVAALSERAAFLSHAENSMDQKDAEEESSGTSDDEVTATAKQEALRNSAAKLFHHSGGDVLARLQALGAFAYANRSATMVDEKAKRHRASPGLSESAITLCQSQGLHAPTLLRTLELREQLQGICESVFAKESVVDCSMPTSPPDAGQEIVLRQIITTGYCDCVARRVSAAVVVQRMKGTGGNISRRKRLTAYLSCNPAVGDLLYLHPQSNLFRADPTAPLPEFVVYGSLIQSHNKTSTYMTGVSVLDAGWLAPILLSAGTPPTLLHFGAPLTSPPPHFDVTSDSVVCYCIPSYGTHHWELPPMKRPLLQFYSRKEDDTATGRSSKTPVGYRRIDEPYRWFARFLLEGSLGLSIKGLPHKSILKETAAVITQLKPSPKISDLLRKLIQKEVCSVNSLRKQMNTNKGFLADEIQPFLVPESRKEFRVAWAKLAVHGLKL